MKAMVKKTAVMAAILLAAALGVGLYNYLRFIMISAPAERVTFASGTAGAQIQLVGQLVKPARDGIFPAVIILHGSGRESMAEPSYRATLNTLVRSGFAVLLYDKRGVGQSGGDFATALYRDFSADASAAVRYLAERDDIDSQHIGLQANSESGWFAPEVAAGTGQVAFIFNRVGSPLSWIDTVAWEVRNEYLDGGITESDVDTLVEFAKRRWRYYIAAGHDPAAAVPAEGEAIATELQRLRREVRGAAEVLPEALPPQQNYADYAANYSYDPGPLLDALDIPMIYVFGETDVKIPTQKSAGFLAALRAAGKTNIDVVVLPGVGHSLANWKGMFTAGYVPAYLDLLSSWCRERVAVRVRR